MSIGAMRMYAIRYLRSGSGMALLELLMVLGSTALLLSLAVPNLHTLQHEWSLWGTARRLESSLQWGRMQAISTNASVQMDMDAGRRVWQWSDPESGEIFIRTVTGLPDSIRISAAPRRPLRFYPRGNAAPAGTFLIQGQRGSYEVIVNPAGRIRVQRLP